jgi:hypothetical protein
MKYLFSLEAASQMENMEEAKKELVELVEQTKPEAMYFYPVSTFEEFGPFMEQL